MSSENLLSKENIKFNSTVYKKYTYIYAEYMHRRKKDVCQILALPMFRYLYYEYFNFFKFA